MTVLIQTQTAVSVTVGKPGARVVRTGTQPAATTTVTRGLKREHSQGAESIPRPLRSRVVAPPAARAVVPADKGFAALQAIVINLNRRPDRMDECATRLKARCPWLKFSRFEATDGKVTAIPESEVSTSWNTARNCIYQRMRSVRKGWDDLDTYKERCLPLSAGERGCSSSHVRAWRKCLELAGKTERPLLVLEDDAAPTPEFTRGLARAMAKLPSDCGVLYLGYSQAADWRREVSEGLVEAEYVWTTVAYIVWPKAARLFLNRLPVNEPVDNWMAGLNAAGDVKAYCVRPKIVLQADAWNVNSDVSHSDEHYWGPDSDIRHSDQLYWGPAEIARSQYANSLPGSSTLLGADSDSEDSDGQP